VIILPLLFLVAALMNFYYLPVQLAYFPLIFAFFQLFLNVIFGRYYGKLQNIFMKAKDSRMRILEEMMNGVKVIKYNSMEQFF
jgi:ABC-type bacteriocin/lantibiotic exporter with double-glycine peptidase domain